MVLRVAAAVGRDRPLGPGMSVPGKVALRHPKQPCQALGGSILSLHGRSLFGVREHRTYFNIQTGF